MVTILNLQNKVSSNYNNCQEHKHYVIGGVAEPGPLGPLFSAISSPNLTVYIINFDNLSLLECYTVLLGKQSLTYLRIIMPPS